MTVPDFLTLRDTPLMPKAVALEVTLFLNKAQKELNASVLIKNTEHSLSTMLGAPVTVKIADSLASEGTCLVILDKLSNVHPVQAHNLMIVAAKNFLYVYDVKMEVNVRFGPLSLKQ